MPQQAPQSVLVWSHGRSGSTLLLDLLASDTQTWSSFEPLQEVRQRPHDAWAFHLDGSQSCRDRLQDENGGNGKGSGGISLSSSCPLRDASLLLSLLKCNNMPLLTTWFGELDLTGHRAAFLPERLLGSDLGRGAAWMRTSYYGRLSNTRASAALSDARSCRERQRRVVKTIRLNGHLDAVYNVSQALGWEPPLVLHLVRDARAIYASRKRLASPFGLPTAGPGGIASARTVRTDKTVRSWARSLCGATQRDREVGQRLGAGAYEYIDYSHFVRRPLEVVQGLYRTHFRRPVPREVREYIAKHLPSSPRRKNNATSNVALASSWQFQYGTAARDVDAVDLRWRAELRPWERQAIEAGCGNTLTLPRRGTVSTPNDL